VAQQVVTCFLLDCGRFVLLSFPSFQHWRLTSLGITSLTVKDGGKEGMKYLSLFLIRGGNIPPNIEYCFNASNLEVVNSKRAGGFGDQGHRNVSI